MIYLIFIIGTLFGSFYLVVGTRMLKGEDVIFTRSHCDNCKSVLKWYELFPILSYIFLKGKCINCKCKLSIVYPIVELSTGLLFSYMFYLYGISYDFYIGVIISSLLVLICITDFKEMIILDSPLIVSVILITILNFIYKDYEYIMHAIIGGVLIFMFFMAIKKIGDILFKRESLGGGDIKLSFIIGYILGFQYALYAVILSSFLALPASVAIMGISKNKEIPYGPFFAGGLLIVFLNIDKFYIIA